MKALFLSLVLFSASALAQTTIPPGTVFAARLNSSLDSGKSHAGQTVTARVMQAVPLPNGNSVPAGARLVGHVVSVYAAANGNPAMMTVSFDRVNFGHQSVPIRAHLRALASMTDVEQAQIPAAGADRGTPGAWTTRNLIGGEVAYGEGGPVSSGVDTVGRALADGVLVPINANLASGCEGDGGTPQALWVFSSDSCGVYGIPDVEIVRGGRRDPIGEFTIASKRGNIEVRSGSGMLLRINDAQ
jgi:hypothetical protein